MWYCKSLTWSLQLNSGASGASTTLNNLWTTAINADLLPSGTRNLGSTTAPWEDLFIGNASGCTLNHFVWLRIVPKTLNAQFDADSMLPHDSPQVKMRLSGREVVRCECGLS
jgi:hypothetical protein